ncbi:hypothetical protein RhiirB3_471904 [Rhizophagus irregularis]|nr:hypothetical protein RhiirB3_471904 [Rhizophagus irregularis]
MDGGISILPFNHYMVQDFGDCRVAFQYCLLIIIWCKISETVDVAFRLCLFNHFMVKSFRKKQEKNKKEMLLQLLAQPLAADALTALDTFLNSLEPLEGYIVKTGRKINLQLYGSGRSIKDFNGTASQFQNAIVLQLMGCALTFSQQHNPSLSFPIMKLAKDNFYKWVYLSQVPRDRDICHFLIEIHDTLEGRFENILKQKNPGTQSQITLESNNKALFSYQQELSKVDDFRKSAGNKVLGELPFQQIEGDEEDRNKGEAIFKEIESMYRFEHSEYDLYSPYEKQQNTYNNNPAHSSYAEQQQNTYNINPAHSSYAEQQQNTYNNNPAHSSYAEQQQNTYNNNSAHSSYAEQQQNTYNNNPARSSYAEQQQNI